MNSTEINIDSWIIPVDILVAVLSGLCVTLVMLFLVVIVVDKTCHTIPMILVANSYLAALLFGSVFFSTVLFALENDLKMIEYQDSLCVFRGYISYAACTILMYSFSLQAIYRFVTVIYPSRLFWQSTRAQLLLISITWIFGTVSPLVFSLNGQIIYNVDNQTCQLTLQLSFWIFYMAQCVYIIPVSLIVFLYFKLIRYIKEMSTRVTPLNTLPRAQRELKMIRRIVILVMILIMSCLPYGIFIIMSFFDKTPKYHFRIAALVGSVTLASTCVALFQFTDPLKASVMKRINGRKNMVVPTVA